MRSRLEAAPIGDFVGRRVGGPKKMNTFMI